MPQFLPHFTTAVDISQNRSPEKWLVQDMIREGRLILLVGHKGVSKTHFAFSLCAEKSLGGVFLGRQLERGNTLYVGLEDEQSDIVNDHQTGRLDRVLQGRATPHNLFILYDWPDLGDSKFKPLFDEIKPPAIEMLAQAIRKFNLKVAVLDTFERLNPSGDGSREGKMLKDLARETNCTIILAAHFKQNVKEDNWMDGIRQYHGLVRISDITLALFRDPRHEWASLKYYGRGVPPVDDTPIRFEYESASFQLVDPKDMDKWEAWKKEDQLAASVRVRPIRDLIVEWFQNHPGAHYYQEAANDLKRNDSIIRGHCWGLARDQRLVVVGGGKYKFPGT